MNDLRLLLQADKDRKIINLEFKQISNLGLMMPILAKFENLETLSLNGNRLQNLPSDLSSLQKLIELDISNNLFKDVQEVIPALKTLPRLSHLMYSLKNDQEQTEIKRQLPTLERLNKKPIHTAAIQNKKVKTRTQVMRLNEKDLEDIAVIYDDIRQVYRKNKYFVDKELADQFDKGVDNIMGELSNKLSLSSVEQQVNSSIVSCRYALIDLCFVKLITYFYHFDRNVASILERIHDNVAESFRNMSDILQAAMHRSKSEIANVAIKKEDLYKKQIKRLKNMQEHHLTEISNLEAKNAELLDKLTKHSKNNILETTVNTIIQKRGRSPGGRALTPLKNNKNISNSMKEQIQATELAVRFNKTLTLHQLKETINEIYTSKNKHNSICLQSGTPMETLQTHMYTYLNQKYGLKPITVEWAMTIVNGIKKYGYDDAEVAAFGKMLRNQLEQQFVEALKKSKNHIRAAIKKFKGEDPQQISTHQCEQILLISGFKRDAIDIMSGRITSEQKKQGHLLPSQLEQLVLEYNLRKHCEKTKGVTITFKQVDADDDGIISQEQLYALVEKLNLKGDVDAEELTQTVDPFNTNVLTYSHLLECMQKMAIFKQAFV